jgi:hypothetical protein
VLAQGRDHRRDHRVVVPRVEEQSLAARLPIQDARQSRDGRHDAFLPGAPRAPPRLDDLLTLRDARQLVRGCLRDPPATIEDEDAVAENACLLKAVGRVHHRDAAPCALPHDGTDPCARFRIEPRRRLVKEQQVRVREERTGEREAVLHPGGVGVEAGVPGVGERDGLQDGVDAGVHLGSGDLIEVGEKTQVLPAREPPVEGALVLAQDHADPVADAVCLATQVGAEDLNRARVRQEDRGEDLHQGRLPGAVRPQDAVHLARRHIEGESVDGGGRGQAVTLAEVAHGDGCGLPFIGRAHSQSSGSAGGGPPVRGRPSRAARRRRTRRSAGRALSGCRKGGCAAQEAPVRRRADGEGGQKTANSPR